MVADCDLPHELARWGTEDGIAPGTTEQAPFPGFHADTDNTRRGSRRHHAQIRGGGENQQTVRRQDTQAIFAKALEAASRMGIGCYIAPKEIVIDHLNGKPYKSPEPDGIGG
jgi:hypothetical protein